MKISTVLFVLLLTVVTSLQAQKEYIDKYEPASSVADFDNMMLLFNHLDFQLFETANLYKNSELKTPSQEILYKAKLCDIVDLWESRKKYLQINKKYGEEYVIDSVRYLTFKQKELKSEINDNCEVLADKRNKLSK